MKELKNELLKNININFMVIFTSIACTLFKSKFVSSRQRFSAVQRSRGHQESAVQKQLMYVNVYITGCYFHICLIFIANCDIKHISRSSHHAVFSLSRSKIVKFDLKFNQKVWKINVEDFILHSVGRRATRGGGRG